MISMDLGDISKISKKVKKIKKDVQGKEEFEEVRLLSNQTKILSKTIKQIFNPNKNEVVILLSTHDCVKIEKCPIKSIRLEV